MDPTLAFTSLLTLATKIFPSLSEYSATISSTFMIGVTLVGIFTNILPEPGHHYLVPDTKELEAELAGNANFILKVAKFTRSLIIGLNWFLNTPVYRGFYDATNAITKLLPWMKKTASQK